MASSEVTYDELVARYQEWDRDRLLVVAQDVSGEYTEVAVGAAREILRTRLESPDDAEGLRALFASADAEKCKPKPLPSPRMPLLLKLMTLEGFFVGLFAVWAVLPGEKNVNDRMIGYTEFWGSGLGPKILLVCLPHMFCAWCFIKRRQIGRSVYLGMSVMTAIWALQTSWSPLPAFISGALGSLFLYWYLFRKRRVREYFAGQVSK
jgi:hypothetical protein